MVDAPKSIDAVMIGRRVEDNSRLLYSGDGPLITVGPSRSYKGRGAIMPTALSYSGSLFVVDPKAECASISSRYRRDVLGQKVVCLDGWGIAGNEVAPECRGGFNAIGGLEDASDEDVVDAADIVRDGLVMPSDDKKDTHWDEESGALIRGLIIHALTVEPPERQNLVTVRDYMRGDLVAFLKSDVMKNERCDGLAATAALEFLCKPEEERGSVQSNANKHTRILDNPRIRKLSRSSSFTMEQLRQTPTTVYCCLPSRMIPSTARWFRLLINVGISRLMQPGLGQVPVLMIVDEFPAFGRGMPMMERAVAEAAGYGLRLWPFLQDLSQAKSLVGDRWQSFIANSGMFQVIGVNDMFTAEQISKRIGHQTITEASQSFGTNTSPDGQPGQTEGVSYKETGVPLVRPEQLIEMAAGRGFAFARNSPVQVCKWIDYRDDDALAGRWDPNPMYGP